MKSDEIRSSSPVDDISEDGDMEDYYEDDFEEEAVDEDEELGYIEDEMVSNWLASNELGQYISKFEGERLANYWEIGGVT